MLQPRAVLRLLEVAVLTFFTSAAHAACTVSSTSVAFGTYNPSSGVTNDTAGTITVQADSTSCGSYTIALGRSGTSYNPRVFTTGVTTNFAYNLYTTSAYTTIWGDGTAGSASVTGAALGANGVRVHTIYGRIPASQSVVPGNYSAQIIVTSSTTSGTITPATGSFVVAATVASCSISATSLAFGIYTGVTLNRTGTVTVNCTNTTSYNVGLSAGTATGATVTTRKMTSGSNLLYYALFSDSGRTTNWGSIPSQGVAGTGSGIAQSLTVYGQIAAGQQVPPGSYTDTVIATITY